MCLCGGFCCSFYTIGLGAFFYGCQIEAKHYEKDHPMNKMVWKIGITMMVIGVISMCCSIPGWCYFWKSLIRFWKGPACNMPISTSVSTLHQFETSSDDEIIFEQKYKEPSSKQATLELSAIKKDEKSKPNTDVLPGIPFIDSTGESCD